MMMTPSRTQVIDLNRLFFTSNIRIVGNAFDIWFVAKDVGEYINDENWHRNSKDIDDEQKKLLKLKDRTGRMQEMLLLSEQGLYYYLLISNKDNAIKFQLFVCHILRQQRKVLLTKIIREIEEHKIYIEIMEYELDKDMPHPYIKLNSTKQQEILELRVQPYIDNIDYEICEELVKLLTASVIGIIKMKFIDDEPWFYLNDVARYIDDLKNCKRIIPKLDGKYVKKINNLLYGGTYINEFGLYMYLFRSKKPKAILFKKEVCKHLQRLRLKSIDDKKIEEKIKEDRRLLLTKDYSDYKCQKHNKNEYLVKMEGPIDIKYFLIPFIYKWTVEYFVVKEIKCDIIGFIFSEVCGFMTGILANMLNKDPVEKIKDEWFGLLAKEFE
jgi:prophage antirepressor-like protein